MIFDFLKITSIETSRLKIFVCQPENPITNETLSDGTTEKPKVFFSQYNQDRPCHGAYFSFFRDLGERPTTASTAVWEAQAGDTGETRDCKL